MWCDPAWVLDMLTAARKVIEYAQGVSETGFLASGRDQDAILRQLTILDEAAKRVSLQFRSEHPEIPWQDVAGFRDVVVHDYFHVNLDEVWRIVREDVPKLAELLEPLVPPPEE